MMAHSTCESSMYQKKLKVRIFSKIIIICMNRHTSDRDAWLCKKDRKVKT